MTEKLSLPNWIHLINSLELTYHKFLDQIIQSQSFVENNPVVADGKIELPLYMEAPLGELMAEAHLIDLLQQSRT
jgi:hypothetical protein